MTQERSRQLGQALMALSGLQLLVFLIAATRRSYLALAVPVGIALGLLSGLGFWVGYTMATTDWDHPADFASEPFPPPATQSSPPADEPVVAAAEGAPPPETLAD
jgi:hypothetical protein